MEYWHLFCWYHRWPYQWTGVLWQSANCTEVCLFLERHITSFVRRSFARYSPHNLECMRDAHSIVCVYLCKPLVHFMQMLDCTDWTCFSATSFASFDISWFCFSGSFERSRLLNYTHATREYVPMQISRKTCSQNNSQSIRGMTLNIHSCSWTCLWTSFRMTLHNVVVKKTLHISCSLRNITTTISIFRNWEDWFIPVRLLTLHVKHLPIVCRDVVMYTVQAPLVLSCVTYISALRICLNTNSCISEYARMCSKIVWIVQNLCSQTREKCCQTPFYACTIPYRATE